MRARSKTGLGDGEVLTALVSGPVLSIWAVDPILSANGFRFPFVLCNMVAKLARRELGFDPLSLRRYYPDQVQRVDGGSKAILSAGSFPSSPV